MEPMCLEIDSSIAKSCMFAGETIKNNNYLKNKLPKNDYEQVESTFNHMQDIINSPKEYSSLIESIYKNPHESVQEMAKTVTEKINNPSFGIELGKALTILEPIISLETKNNDLFNPENYIQVLKQHPEHEKARDLLNKFRVFVGEYGSYNGGKVTAVIAWQPPNGQNSNMTSSRAYPESGVMVLGVPSNITQENISLEGPFHESIHMIFQDESPKVILAMEKAGFFEGPEYDKKQEICNDMGEALAYLFHYDFYQTEVKEKPGKIYEILESKSRSPVVLKQLKFAKNLKGSVNSYISNGNSMDEKFFEESCRIYKELIEKEPSLKQ